MRNAAEVRSVLEKSGVVIAVFSGHYHEPGYQLVNGIHYVMLQANVAYGNDASYHNQFATVDVLADGRNFRVLVNGNARQKTHILKASLK